MIQVETVTATIDPTAMLVSVYAFPSTTLTNATSLLLSRGSS